MFLALRGTTFICNLLSMFVEFCVVVDQDKEGDNAVVGPVPLMQDGANQDIRE